MQPPNIAAIFLILSGIQGALTIRIDPDVEWLELTTGADFVLKCYGSEELKWEYPPSVQAGNKTSSKTVMQYKLSDEEYRADLIIKRAHYMDTGFYNCSNENYTDELQLYLYVRDADHLLAVRNSDDYIMISHPQFQDLIIPCKPTSLDVNVTLIKDEPDDTMVPFDRRKGFIIKEVLMSDSGYYTCLARRQANEQSVTFHVSIFPRSESVSKPIISIEGYEGKHIIVGQDITMGCHVVELPGVDVTLEWEAPANAVLEKISYSPMFAEKVEVRGIPKRRSSRNLAIKNVSEQDEGIYICRVSDHSKNYNEEQYKLEVFSEDMKFLNLSMEGKSEIQVRVSEREAQWIVNIDAYPTLITKKWFGPDGSYLHHASDKYTIIFDATKTKVTVHNITIEDSGLYTLFASNAVKNETLNVTLLVEDKPQVYLKPNYPKKYFDINKEIVIDCFITAYPIPAINWTFTECSDQKTFCAPGNRGSPIHMDASSLASKGFVKWHSQAKWYARDSGIIKCKAENYLGTGEDYIEFKVSDVDNGFDIWGPKHRVLTSDSIVIGCGASVYEYESNFEWIYKSLNGSKQEIITTSSRKGISITTNVTSFSSQTFLHIHGVKEENSGSFFCRVKSTKDFKYKELEFKLIVQGRMAPVFTNATNLFVNGSVVNLDLGRPINFTCMVYAVPEAEVIWYKDGKVIVPKADGRIRIENKNQTLLIAYTEYEDGGKYRCTASNGLETTVTRFITLKLKGPARPSRVWEWASYIFISLILTVIVLVIALIWSFFRKTNTEKAKRKALGLYPIAEKDFVPDFNPNVDISEQADLLPYHRKWEFPRDKLKLTSTHLGVGAFGVVIKGEATGLPGSDKPVIVAVKMVKQSTDISHVKALVDELKIMGNLGQHLNVVNLLGACTENVHKKDLLVIVEYCKYGNLHKYLINHRNTFINQINEQGVVDFSYRNTPNEITYVNASLLTTTNGTNEDTNGLSVQTDMTSLSTPIGEDGYLMNVDMISNYQGDYKMNSTRYISTKDLFCWGYQVAKGMEYLASRKVVHGDLAARNVLLAEGNIVKISDFGLAKKLYYKDKYENKKRNIPLPVKWMSIEAIQDGIFSTQSDIWSFGVFLWELFSLGATPYPGLWGETFYNSLVKGERMKKPEYANNDVYNLMLECWKEQPMLRPLFTECADRLGSLLGETVKQDYIELNNPYMQKNSSITPENDYLGKLNEPSYENFIHSGMPEDNLDYVCMKAPKTDALNDMELRPMITPGSISYLNPGYQDMKNFSEHKYSNVPHNLTHLENEQDSDHDQTAEHALQPEHDPESDHAELEV